jgi:hypothetical protein
MAEPNEGDSTMPNNTPMTVDQLAELGFALACDEVEEIFQGASAHRHGRYDRVRIGRTPDHYQAGLRATRGRSEAASACAHLASAEVGTSQCRWWRAMTPRDRLSRELYVLSDTVTADDLTEQELADMVALFRTASARVIPANVIYLKPRAAPRNRKRAARV